MRLLFIHQNFPGQFRHLARFFAHSGEHEVVALGEDRNLKQRPPLHQNIQTLWHSPHRQAHASTHHYLRDFETHICRGQAVARSLTSLKKNGFTPDLVMAHPGWGESLFLRDFFPSARHIYYFEYYYHSLGGDVGFDPEFPSSLDGALKVRVKNSTQLHALVDCDVGLSPTQWQKSRYPREFQEKISVTHDGINTALVRPDTNAWIQINGQKFRAGDPIVTYVSRNLEPYRGFHTFIRALPKIQALCPQASVIIVGGDDVSYGSRPAGGQTYKAIYTHEVKDQVDWSKVHFVPRLDYENYVRLLQVSAVHVYLTYPFVLSWSMLEAMSAGCAVVASDTAPVAEVIKDGVNGRLFNFFDPESLAGTVKHLIGNRLEAETMRANARQTVVEHYDLDTVCLPRLINFIKENIR